MITALPPVGWSNSAQICVFLRKPLLFREPSRPPAFHLPQTQKPFLPITLATLALLGLPFVSRAEPKWIWVSKQASANEKASFQKTFTINGNVKTARLELTCDNGASVFINGKPAGVNSDWGAPLKANVKALLKPGENVIRVEGKNEGGAAALVARLNLNLADGSKQVVETGADWLAASPGGSPKPAVVIANYGDAPWGDAFKGGGAAGGVTEPEAVVVPAGFKVELLHTVNKDTEGSWVGITVDPQGRLITCDQRGGLFRVTLPPLGTSEGTKVEPLVLPPLAPPTKNEKGETIRHEFKGAHGILYAFNSLYAMVNEDSGHGLYRMKDDGNGNFGKPELLRKTDGSSEHGPHSLTLSPDGKSLFFSNGNHTKLPENLELARAAKIWQEDHLLPRMWDANGHAKGILAPGGYICKTDPDGKTVELYSAGFRNEFDIAFSPDGDLFTYDSDMEWDIGTPWYRPTRICQAVSGAEFGWRSGSGKWPSYYPDSLPATLDIGPGSPTGTTFGTGAKFPAKYQRAFFAADWTYGTMYAIHLAPDGAGFKAVKEEFISGKPLPLTDMLIHPKDGAMYFMIGGRGTQSALYRTTYVGTESTAPAPKIPLNSDAKLRRELEKFHEAGTGPDCLPKAWPHLSSPDRFVRFAARVAIERQPATLWADKALAEKNPQAKLEALVALARAGDKSLQSRILSSLAELDFAKQPADLRFSLLRAYGLAFTRMGKPSPEVCSQIAARFNGFFPSTDLSESRELAQLLIFLDSPSIVAKVVPLLDTTKDLDVAIGESQLIARNDNYAKAVLSAEGSQPNRQAFMYAYFLRNAKVGWTPELRQAFFGWFPRTAEWKGGNSFRGFLNNIRNEALANFAPENERAALEELSKKAPANAVVANAVMPKGPGKNWAVADVVTLAQNGVKGRDFENGKAMFKATLCLNCHHFAGDGGNIGPDLTGSGNRYTINDLAENIIAPSKVISDQYGTEELSLKNGGTVIGRVVTEENGKLLVMTSALAPDALTTVAMADIAGRKPFNISMMPPGLINSLNAEELLDLVAYLQSGGNPKDKAFAK